ncbi:M24 family metallopeptidase [Nocardioides mangrovi]|uniref:Xaa-Pro peptidase family protein n=1 Tax=Nocardioides mangrovi TaxID=2874580 RepID=A0ABS7UFC9_9ACTN|nr:Xaa-Pro peptidase family protein [Nocardioides mangrovi]MBZ5739362.1 Xaa-Pro peptidase family protein [Nocardioides mangrovi]
MIQIGSTHVPDALPFPVEEYRDRHTRVRAAMTRRGLDVLVVTSPANLCWLTGYAASWYPPRLPVSLLLHREAPELVIADWSRHRDYVPLVALHDELELLDDGRAPAQVATALDRRGWLGGRVALEWHETTPVPGTMVALADELRSRGAALTRGDRLVDDLRLVKSEAELAVVRRAASILDDAFEALAGLLRPGATELQVAATLSSLLAERGSEVPAQHPLVSSGPTAWADVHAFPSARVIERGEIVSVDACAVVDRYHVNLQRTFALGHWDQRAADYLDAGRRGQGVLCARAVPDAAPAAALAAAQATVAEDVPADHTWWVGGYSLGVSFPPSWTGHRYLSDDGSDGLRLAPGYVTNFETITVVPDSGAEASAIDTLVMTTSGLTPLSRLARGLWRLDG